MIVTCAWTVVALLAGSLNPALLLTRLLRGVDLRDLGSGNAGASNAARILGWRWGLPVLLLDVGKGWLLLSLPSLLGATPQPLAPWLWTAAALAGTRWPPLLRFNGGKGAALGLGLCLAIHPAAAGGALLVALLLLLARRPMAQLSLAGAAVAPGIAALQADWQAAGLLLLLLLFLLWSHRGNIARMKDDRESAPPRNW